MIALVVKRSFIEVLPEMPWKASNRFPIAGAWSTVVLRDSSLLPFIAALGSNAALAFNKSSRPEPSP